MNRRVGMAILASIFAVMGAACSQGAGEGAAVGTGRIVAPVSKVTVGLDDQFPPMTFRDEKNEFIGFDVDMAREAAKRVGCDIEFKSIEWSSKEADLYNKSIDMIWSATTITKVRALGMRFSQPYMENQQIIVVRTGSPITAKEDLVGKTVAVQAGSTSLIAVEADPQVKTFKEVRPYESNLNALDDLGKGLRSQVGTMFGTKAKGARYLELAQGYVTRMALNDKNEIIAFEFLNLGKFTDALKAGKSAEDAIQGAMGHYGQWDNAAKYIDPRTDEETHSVASTFPVHE